MFYRITEKDFFGGNVYLKEVELEGGEKGYDTYYLDRLKDEQLRGIGIARVEVLEKPEFNEYQNLKEVQAYKEESNVLEVSYEAEDKPLEELKEIQKQKIENKKNFVINEGFSYQDKVYQCNTYDQTLIIGKVSQIQINPSVSIEWIAKDNTIKTFTPQDFITFASALAVFIEEVTFKARGLKDKILEATSKEEVIAVAWE